MINWRFQAVAVPVGVVCAVAASPWIGVWRVMLIFFALGLVCLLSANLLVRMHR